jgi:hypothetical protein
MKKTFLLLMLTFVVGVITSYGQTTTTRTELMSDFQATDNFGNTCYYKITDVTNRYVTLWPKEKRVTTTYTFTSFSGQTVTSVSNDYEGNESHFNTSGTKGGLPATVVNPNNNETYYVKAVGALAHSDLRFNSVDTIVVSEGIEDFVDAQAMMWCAVGSKVLILPSTLKSGVGTFRENWSLKKVVGLEHTQLKRLSDYFFTQCGDVTNDWVLPPTVTYLGEHCLPFNTTQKKFIFPASVDSINSRFVDYNGFKNVKVFRSENPIPPTVFLAQGTPTPTQPYQWKFLTTNPYSATATDEPDSIYVPVDVTAAYEAKNGWSSYVGKFFEEVKIGPNGYTSYYLENENFQVPTGCTAYIIKSVDQPVTGSVVGNAQVVAFTAGKVLPAKTGFILQGTAGKTIAYQANVSGVTEEDVTGNLLVGTAVEKEFSGAGYRYYLFGKGVKGQGFYHQTGRDGNSIKLPAHRAGLKLSTSGPDFAPAKELIFNFDDATTTGVNTVQPSVEKKNDVIYDLQGRRVTNPSRGIYIVNGKKVVISK